MRGDKGIDYGKVMAVVGTINRAGFAKVALLTEMRPGANGGGAGTMTRSGLGPLRGPG